MATNAPSVPYGILIIHGYLRNCSVNSTAIPADIANVICFFFDILMHFNIANKYNHQISLNIDSKDLQKDRIDVVISFGSGLILGGVVNDMKHPQIAIPNIIADTQNNKICIGHEANVPFGVNPIQNGKVTNWNAIKIILTQIISQIIKLNKNIGLTIVTSINWNKLDREKMIKICFDIHNCTHFWIVPAISLCLYGANRTTGTVVLLDYHHTEIVVIFESIVIHKMCVNLGKSDIFAYLECNKWKTNDIDAGMEVLFNPKLCISKEKHSIKGIHYLINECIMNSDVDILLDEYRNIILCGINSLYNNIHERVKNELKKLVAPAYVPQVSVPLIPDRDELSWIGGSMLIQSANFPDSMWIKRNEYYKEGVSIVNKKGGTYDQVSISHSCW